MLGEFAAACALYGRYRTLPSFLTGPNICRLEAGGPFDKLRASCQVLFRTKNAAMLGVPNSALGVLYYPLLGLGLILKWPLPLLLAASTSAFLMTLWLAWILIRDNLECRVCWTGHVCNTILWFLLLQKLVF